MDWLYGICLFVTGAVFGAHNPQKVLNIIQSIAGSVQS